MPHRLHTAWVELADFRPRCTWQCPRSFFRVAPPNVRVQPPSAAKQRRLQPGVMPLFAFENTAHLP